jgi:hypothetical protein
MSIINQVFLGMSFICEGRLLISHEAPKCSGFAAEISATIQVITHNHTKSRYLIRSIKYTFQRLVPNISEFLRVV